MLFADQLIRLALELNINQTCRDKRKNLNVLN